MKRNLKTKQWNPLSFRLFSLASMISRSFQTVRRMREAWKWETYVRSQSFSSESAVKYLHVGRRKIQISPSLGEQDQSNALPQGQQRQSSPHPMPCLPPSDITFKKFSLFLMSAKRCNIRGVLYDRLQSVSDTRDNSGGSRGGARGSGSPPCL